jgi:tetratricopeptide (TPR) repeat protein
MPSSSMNRAGLGPRARLAIVPSLLLFVGYCATQGECSGHLGTRVVPPPSMQANSVDELETHIASLQRDFDRGPATLGGEAWANRANELGHALMRIGQTTGNAERLQAARTAFEGALNVWTRKTSPGEWAGMHLNLGAVNALLGHAQSSAERLRVAADAYEAALELFSRDSAPAEWAAAQNGLGGALLNLAILEHDPQVLVKSVDALQAALTVRTRERTPEQWAMTRANLGDAQRTPAGLKSQPPCDGLESHVAALEVLEDVGPEYHERIMRRVHEDLQASPRPTPESCPQLPAVLWALLDALAADAARAP